MKIGSWQAVCLSYCSLAHGQPIIAKAMPPFPTDTDPDSDRSEVPTRTWTRMRGAFSAIAKRLLYGEV